jgi:hypothetical protein
MFAASREKGASFVRTQLGVQKAMSALFFTSTTLIVSEALPKGRKFNQDYFISTVLPELVKAKRRLLRKKPEFPFLIQMDNSGCYDGHTITDKKTAADITRTPDPPYSPDLSHCDFWFFGFLKESMKGIEL